MATSNQEPAVVTTTMFTPSERAAWEVAVSRDLPITAADLRALLEAAAPNLLPDLLRRDPELVARWLERARRVHGSKRYP